VPSDQVNGFSSTPDEQRPGPDRSVGREVPSCASWPAASRWRRRVR